MISRSLERHADPLRRHCASVCLVACVVGLLIPVRAAQAQPVPRAATTSTEPAKAETPQDVLGRSTPRGTVLGFLGAARRGEDNLASQYLNTRLTGDQAVTLARQLFVVLDARFPARVAQISDAPEGSRTAGTSPALEIVGTITAADGPLDIVVERLAGGDSGPIWLFSSRTLATIPAVYDEVMLERSASLAPRVLTNTRVAGIRLVEWVVLVLGLAILYLLTALFNRVLTLLLTRVRPRTFGQSDLVSRGVVPAPARLLIVSLLSRWFLASLPFSLFMRQIGFSVASLVTISSLAWLLMHVAGEAERYIQRAFPGAGTGAAKSLLRLVRRAFDVLVIFAALLATLQHFGIDPTVALAGLGVGGIAVALAAQKTLENVIAGASLIFDQAVKVGDFLRMGQTTGTVEHIGLRSTRIRTLDRTVVSVPNSQIANASLETLSSRDQFWFHPIVGLRYETTSEQLRDVVESIRRLLSEHESVVRESVRVRFIRLGAFSLDVEVVAYINARDWPHFLEIQEHLLFQVIEIVERAGTAIAFPSQTLYVESADPSSAATARSLAGKVPIDR